MFCSDELKRKRSEAAKKEEAPKRTEIFKPFGYETLVIWVKELESIKKLKVKLEPFCREDGCLPAEKKGGA